MDTLIDFFSFSDPNVRYVAGGSVLLSASSAIVGSFTLLKKKALVGDAVAHAVLPGICAAFLVAGAVKQTAWMVAGAFLTGWLALVLIDYITAVSKLKKDAAIGLVLSVFFGFGMVLMTYIQQSGHAAQSGLDHFIFGKAAALIGTDLVVFSVIAVILIAVVLLFFKEFTLVAFDEAYARSLGYPVYRLDLLLTSLTVLAVVTGITAVGVVLMAAMLITPGAAARYWTDNLRVMVILAAVIGAFSGLAGAYLSYAAPAMPTGPWMVIVSSLIAFASFFFAPKKGIVANLYLRWRNKRQILEENTLKIFYQLGESDSNPLKVRSLSEIRTFRELGKENLRKSLMRLERKNILRKQEDGWQLTEQGMVQAARVVRLHRLWELYLTNYMQIAADHVHDDAETMEHVITPELEKELEHQLNYPDTDPHQAKIPKIKEE